MAPEMTWVCWLARPWENQVKAADPDHSGTVPVLQNLINVQLLSQLSTALQFQSCVNEAILFAEHPSGQHGLRKRGKKRCMLCLISHRADSTTKMPMYTSPTHCKPKPRS